jgi:hypothetical protein
MDRGCCYILLMTRGSLTPLAERLATMTLMILLLYPAFFDYLPNMQWTRYDQKLSLTLI